jgi:hypothetical protein
MEPNIQLSLKLLLWHTGCDLCLCEECTSSWGCWLYGLLCESKMLFQSRNLRENALSYTSPQIIFVQCGQIFLCHLANHDNLQVGWYKILKLKNNREESLEKLNLFPVIWIKQCLKQRQSLLLEYTFSSFLHPLSLRSFPVVAWRLRIL